MPCGQKTIENSTSEGSSRNLVFFGGMMFPPKLLPYGKSRNPEAPAGIRFFVLLVAGTVS